jgi:hypothetical protein
MALIIQEQNEEARQGLVDLLETGSKLDMVMTPELKAYCEKNEIKVYAVYYRHDTPVLIDTRDEETAQHSYDASNSNGAD